MPESDQWNGNDELPEPTLEKFGTVIDQRTDEEKKAAAEESEKSDKK